MQWRIRSSAHAVAERNCPSVAGTGRARRRIFIIHNAIAGMRRRWLLRNVCRELEAAGVELSVVAADSLEMDIRLARDAAASGDYDAVVAAGGDSTVRGAGIGLVGSGVPLGIIPIGTGNVLAEEIRFRGRPRTVASRLVHGPAVPIHAGRANSSCFFAMAGAGFDARVLARLDTRWKRRLGKLAYVWPVLRELARTPVVFNAVIDGEHHRCNWLIIAKAARYGGPFLLTRRQSLEKAGFHAVIINARTRFALMGVIMAIALGRAERHRDVRIIPCQRATIPRQPGIPIQLDGEMSGEAPLEIESTALPVHLIYPH